jgi:hypothetical protein
MLHSQLIQETSGINGLRDEGLLESALEALFQAYDDQDLFPTVQAKAARLGYGLIKNHTMVDGNIRTDQAVAHIILAVYLSSSPKMRPSGPRSDHPLPKKRSKKALIFSMTVPFFAALFPPPKREIGGMSLSISVPVVLTGADQKMSGPTWAVCHSYDSILLCICRRT